MRRLIAGLGALALVALAGAFAGNASADNVPPYCADTYLDPTTHQCWVDPDPMPIGGDPQAFRDWQCRYLARVGYPCAPIPPAPAPDPAPAPAPAPLRATPAPAPKPKPTPKPKRHKRRHKVVEMGGRSDAPAVSRAQYNLEMDIGRYYENDIEAFARCRYPTMTWTHHGIDRKDAWPRFRYRCGVDFVDYPAGGRETTGTATVTYDRYGGSWRYRWHKGG